MTATLRCVLVGVAAGHALSYYVVKQSFLMYAKRSLFDIPYFKGMYVKFEVIPVRMVGGVCVWNDGMWTYQRCTSNFGRLEFSRPKLF